jgi:hypothetical protein
MEALFKKRIHLRLYLGGGLKEPDSHLVSESASILRQDNLSIHIRSGLVRMACCPEMF